MGAVQERLPWHSMEETYIFSGLLQAHNDDDLFGTAGEQLWLRQEVAGSILDVGQIYV